MYKFLLILKNILITCLVYAALYSLHEAFIGPLSVSSAFVAILGLYIANKIK